MSFTVRVKEELLSLKRFEKSELAAIIKMSGSLGISMGGLTLSVTTENAKIARHIYELLHHFYEAKSDIRHHQKTNLKKIVSTQYSWMKRWKRFLLTCI